MTNIPQSTLEAAGLVRVHPVADLFPLMPEDELQELADDIAANGLREPLVRTRKKELVDGARVGLFSQRTADS
jgi:hypothetical protein